MIPLLGPADRLSAAEPAVPIGSARVLLVFAPSGQDPRLDEQQRMLSEDREGAAERDLVLVPVAGTGPASKATGRTIDEAGNRRLRERYAVAAGTFSVLLIGKDGGVKLRSRSVVPAARLFALVDAMPMRRAEMGR